MLPVMHVMDLRKEGSGTSRRFPCAEFGSLFPELGSILIGLGSCHSNAMALKCWYVMIPLLTGFNTLVLTDRKIGYECGGILIAKVVQATGTSTTRHVRPQTIQQRHIWDFMSKEIVKAN